MTLKINKKYKEIEEVEENEETKEIEDEENEEIEELGKYLSLPIAPIIIEVCTFHQIKWATCEWRKN